MKKLNRNKRERQIVRMRYVKRMRLSDIASHFDRAVTTIKLEINRFHKRYDPFAKMIEAPVMESKLVNDFYRQEDLFGFDYYREREAQEKNHREAAATAGLKEGLERMSAQTIQFRVIDTADGLKRVIHVITRDESELVIDLPNDDFWEKVEGYQEMQEGLKDKAQKNFKSNISDIKMYKRS